MGSFGPQPKLPGNSYWAFGPAPVGGLRPQGGLRPNKIVEEGGVCAMVTASPSFVFSKNGLPPLRPPYVCEHPSPATADRSLALGPFEEQPHQLFGKGNRIHGGFPSRSIGMKFPPILWWELYIIYNPASGCEFYVDSTETSCGPPETNTSQELNLCCY